MKSLWYYNNIGNIGEMSIFGDELDLLKSLLGKDFVFGFTSEEKRGILIRPISFSKQMTAS